MLSFAADFKPITLRSDFDILQHNPRTAPYTDKCVHLSIGQHPIVSFLLHDDAPIGTLGNTRNLEVFGKTIFKPSLHIKLAVSRAPARFFQVHHGFALMVQEALLPLYLSLFRPILELKS